METSKKIEALSVLNDNPLEILIDRGKLASYLPPPSNKINNLEHTSQFKLVKDPQLNQVHVFLIN